MSIHERTITVTAKPVGCAAARRERTVLALFALAVPGRRFVPCIFGCLLLAACGSDAPPLDAADVSDASLNQADNEWLLINYWATWCKPCIEEVPELNAFMREYRHRARVLAVNFDGLEGSKLDEEAARLGFKIPLLTQDPYVHYGYPLPQVLPTTIVINPAGAVHQILVGPQTVDSLARTLDSTSAPTGAG